MQMNVVELTQHLKEEHLEYFERKRARLMARIHSLDHDMPRYDADGDGFVSRGEAVEASNELDATVVESGIGPGILMYGNQVI
jgi:hypothetical protein